VCGGRRLGFADREGIGRTQLFDNNDNDDIDINNDIDNENENENENEKDNENDNDDNEQEWPELVGETFGSVLYRFDSAVPIGIKVINNNNCFYYYCYYYYYHYYYYSNNIGLYKAAPCSTDSTRPCRSASR
jgi:hypothetical protein